MHPSTLFSRYQKRRFAQHREVARHLGLRQAQHTEQVAYAQFAACEQKRENTPPGFVGQCFEEEIRIQHARHYIRLNEYMQAQRAPNV